MRFNLIGIALALALLAVIARQANQRTMKPVTSPQFAPSASSTPLVAVYPTGLPWDGVPSASPIATPRDDVPAEFQGVWWCVEYADIVVPPPIRMIVGTRTVEVHQQGRPSEFYAVRFVRRDAPACIFDMRSGKRHRLERMTIRNERLDALQHTFVRPTLQ